MHRGDAIRLTHRLLFLGQQLSALAAEWEAPESNCLLWAFQQVEREGGAIRLTPSAYGPWLHAQWEAPDGSVWEWDLLGEKVAGAAPPALFPGTPRRIGP